MQDVRRLKTRYAQCDFAGNGPSADWVVEDRLLKALEVLTLSQRLVWEARFCGITRAKVRGIWVEQHGERMSADETADMLGTDRDVILHMTQRAARALLAVLA